MADTVSRRLVFSAWEDGSSRNPFDRFAAADAVSSITEGDLVLEHGDALTAVELVQRGTDDEPTCFRLLALRDYANRPSVWAPGTGARAVTIAGDQYTAYLTHVAIWDDQIATHDAYTDAPGIGRLTSYLRDLTDERVLFRALYEPGLARRLKDLKGVRRIEYGLRTPHKIQLVEGKGLLGTLVPEAFGTRAPSIRVSLGMGRRSRRDDYVDRELTEEIIQIADNAEQFFDALIITGKSKTEKTDAGNPKTVTVNLLSQRLQVSASVARDPDGGNVPDAKALYREFVQARKALDQKGTLEKAVEGRLALQEALIPPDE